jgi:hypothetical protein
VSGTASPIINIGELRPDLLVQAQETLWAGRGNSNAGAGTFAAASVFNPASSGLIVTIEGVRVYTSIVPGTITMYYNSAVAGGAIFSLLARDSRVWAQPTPLQGSTGPLGALPPAANVAEDIIAITASQGYEFTSLPIVLLPGAGLLVAHNTVTTPFLGAQFRGRYRTAELTEISA